MKNILVFLSSLIFFFGLGAMERDLLKNWYSYGKFSKDQGLYTELKYYIDRSECPSELVKIQEHPKLKRLHEINKYLAQEIENRIEDNRPERIYQKNTDT
jgi:hypothetical protein